MSEDVDENRQPDDRLSRGHGHRHEREQLAVEVLKLARESDQRQVGGVEHQLDADQDDQRVPAHEHAYCPEDEQDRGQEKEPGRVQLRAAGVESAHLSSPSFRLRYMAPIPPTTSRSA